MSEPLEDIYIELYDKLSKIVVPLVMQNPSHNIALSKSSATNAISEAFTPLNKILSALGKKPVPFVKWIEYIRQSEVNTEEVVIKMIEARNVLEVKKGECINKVRQYLEKMKSVNT